MKFGTRDHSLRSTEIKLNQPHTSLAISTRQKERLNESKNYFIIFNKWRWMDLMSTVFALIGIVLAIVNYEIDLN